MEKGETAGEEEGTGWRVGFRTMEAQITDYENAAFSTILVLLSRVVLFFDLSLYIPISLVDENMRRAHGRDALHESKFYFRKHLIPLSEQCSVEWPKAEPWTA